MPSRRKLLRKDVRRECVDKTASRTQCVSREFCEWRKESKIPITAADIVFVVGGTVCELYTTYRLYMHDAKYNHGNDGKCTILVARQTVKTEIQHFGSLKWCNDRGPDGYATDAAGIRVLLLLCFLAIVLVGVSCLAEALLLCCEGYTVLFDFAVCCEVALISLIRKARLGGPARSCGSVLES